MSGYSNPVIPWSNVYGVARTLLASATGLTLLFTDADTLFRPIGSTISEAAIVHSLVDWGLFALVGDLELGRWLAIAGLCVVASGWRPRWTAFLHWWITASFAMACVPADGGDHIASMLTLILLPLGLTDGRTWHWSAPTAGQGVAWELRVAVANSTVHAARFMVACIYLHAGAGKMFVTEWLNGTALYYWFLDPQIGAADPVRSLLEWPLTNPVIVTLSTWSVIVFETLLFLALFGSRRLRSPLLWLGLGFHASIVVVHGLASFFLVMAAALVMLLRHVEEPFAWSMPLTRVLGFHRFASSSPDGGVGFGRVFARWAPWRTAGMTAIAQARLRERVRSSLFGKNIEWR